MRYWYDTEFYEDGSTIELISIGIVSENRRGLYLENEDFDWTRVPKDHWLWENVYPHLTFEEGILLPKWKIADAVRWYITDNGWSYNNELWGYYSSYDHVVLAQLFGRMVDMPEGVPWFTMDVKQECVRRGLDPNTIPQTSTAHNALNDALWTKEVWEWLQEGTRDG